MNTIQKIPITTTRALAPSKRPKQLTTRIPAFIRDHLELKKNDIIVWEAIEYDEESYVILKKQKYEIN